MIGLLRIAAVLGAAMTLPACTTLGFSNGSPTMISVDAVRVPSTVAKMIADDLVASLATTIGPGTTTLVLATGGSGFPATLEKSLRDAGYAVTITSSPETNGTRLTYVLDTLDSTAVLARLSTPKLALARLYTISPDGAEPTSPLSVLHRE